MSNVYFSFTCSLLALVLWAGAPAARAQGGSPCGDANGDGRVNTADARLVQRCVIGQIPCPAQCDVTGEGRCTTTDARLIQRVAVGQLVVGQLRCDAPPPAITASFEQASTRLEEGEIAALPIVLDAPFGGSLELRVTGTASAADLGLGGSCQELGAEIVCSLLASGTTAVFDVEAVDDADPPGAFEELEWAALEIVATPGVAPGAVARHVVVIANNDAAWEGVFTSDGEELPFTLEIQRQGEGATARLVSDGCSWMPAGTTDLGAITFDLAAGLFHVSLPTQKLDERTTGIPGGAEVTIDLRATAATGRVSRDLVEGRADLGSLTRFDLSVPGAAHLDQSLPGSFVLRRRAARPSSVPSALTSAGGF